MRSKYSRCLTLIPLLVLAILLQSGCGVYLRRNLYGKVVVYARSGQSLQWPFPVTFQESQAPCTVEKTKDGYKCQIRKPLKLGPGQTFARYTYNCADRPCPDPEVEVGMSSKIKFQGFPPDPTPLPTPDQIVGIECKTDSTIGLIPATTGPLKVNQLLTFEDRGAPWVQSWAVVVPAGTCAGDPTINRDQPSCKIAASTPGNISYTVRDGANVCREATGTITVVP